MNILVTGAAGYIGSHCLRALLKTDHKIFAVDDLSHGNREAIDAAATGLTQKAAFFETNVSDQDKIEEILKTHRIEAVVHFAAYIEVGESVENPGKYYANNFGKTVGLLNAMKNTGVKKIVFSSTAAVYGNPQTVPIPEEHPFGPINPYGRSKMMVEMALEDFAKAHGLGCAILRYFNVAGASPESVIGEAHEPESHLIPRVLSAAAGQMNKVGIFGTDYPTRDGTCVRDYVHVEDLVEAHLLALNSIQSGRVSVYNLGSENGFTVREVIAACSKVVGKQIPFEEKERRAGDPAQLIAGSSKIRKELGWKPRYPDLETIVKHAWNWHQKNPNGYRR